ncbi:MAG: hypothetical protein KC613_10675, partial [Myxococcales bacterium]|nr:hypothetical protein [Myxococcales bacterium]
MNAHLARVLRLAAPAFVLWLSACTTAETPSASECLEDGHCNAGERCVSGACTPNRVDAGGQGGAGGGGGGTTCRTDSDCRDGRCVDGECFANQCAEGAERPCSSDCGDGTQTCRGGVWRPCTAQQAVAEICGDGRDNDCNGTIDDNCGGCSNGDERP